MDCQLSNLLDRAHWLVNWSIDFKLIDWFTRSADRLSGTLICKWLMQFVSLDDYNRTVWLMTNQYFMNSLKCSNYTMSTVVLNVWLIDWLIN